MGIYDPLYDWLRGRTDNRIPVTFAQVEGILHFDLPNTARSRSQWWQNNSTRHVQAHAWLEAGFHTEDVNLRDETVVFTRTLGG